MNTNYTSRVKPNFDNAGVQDVQIKAPVATVALSQEIKVQQENAVDIAQINYNRQTVDLAQKYGTDFKGLNEALLSVEQNSFNDFRERGYESLGMDLLKQQDSVRLRLVDRSRDMFITEQNKKQREASSLLLSGYQQSLTGDYVQYLDNLTKPAEQRDNNALIQWQNGLQQIDNLLDRRDTNGNPVFSDSTRKGRANVQSYMENGAMSYIDRMITNGETEKAKDYYTKNILAPDRYMTQTGMDRDTYNKVRSYAEKQLKQADVDIKNAQFNQSVSEAMALQVEFLPSKMDQLQEQGLLDKKLIRSIEDTNVKFSNINPAKAELPLTMINTLSEIQKWDITPAQTPQEQQAVIETGQRALDALADYGQRNGMSPQSQRRVRETIMNKERSKAFGAIMDNFADLSKFGGISGAWASLTGHDGMTDRERTQAGLVDNTLAIGLDAINENIRKGDWNGVQRVQKDVQKRVAQIRYMYDIPSDEWDKMEKSDDKTLMFRGQPVKFLGYTFDGDIILDDGK